jgi:hypothetical protein
MPYSDILPYIDFLESTLGAESQGFKYVSASYAAHPNMRVHEDFQGIVRLCTSDVNEYVNEVDFVYRSDDGGSLLAFPFYSSKEGKVYSDPPSYVVGYRNPNGFGCFPLLDWKLHFKDAEICDIIVDKTKNYLGSHAPVDYEPKG